MQILFWLRRKGLATGMAASPAKGTLCKALVIIEAEIEIEQEINAKSKTKMVSAFNAQWRKALVVCSPGLGVEHKNLYNVS